MIPETLYGLVELLVVFGLVILFCLWQLISIEKTRERLRQEEDRNDRRD